MTANAILFAAGVPGAQAGGAGSRAGQPGRLNRRQPPRQFNAIWLLLALGALVYAGYYFYFRDVPSPASTVAASPGYADAFSGLMDQALTPIEDGPSAAALQADLRGLERRLAAGRDNPQLAQYGQNLCWQLRELLKIRGQCEAAVASIQAGRFEGLGGTRFNRQRTDQKEFALQEQARVWQGQADQARPVLAAGLARLRQSENR